MSCLIVGFFQGQSNRQNPKEIETEGHSKRQELVYFVGVFCIHEGILLKKVVDLRLWFFNTIVVYFVCEFLCWFSVFHVSYLLNV